MPQKKKLLKRRKTKYILFSDLVKKLKNRKKKQDVLMVKKPRKEKPKYIPLKELLNNLKK